VTGGAGYIGSHTCVALAQAGRDFLILDNLSNAKRSVPERLSKIVGFKVQCVESDVSDVGLVTRLLEEHKVGAVIHSAALKAVGELVAQPLRYYRNNVAGSIALFEAMRRAGVGTIVFSSSTTVYGDPASVLITEDFPLCPTNPYGRTKLFTEQILADLVESEPDFWRVARLRYFNSAGAHESGLIGEDPMGVPNNLVPFVAKVASGQHPFLSAWGNDYPTRDGTSVRDYIHVMDLAEGHVAALRYLENPRAWSHSTSARAKAPLCWSWLRSLSERAAEKSRSRLVRGARGMWLGAGRTLGLLSRCWDGRLEEDSRRAVRTPG